MIVKTIYDQLPENAKEDIDFNNIDSVIESMGVIEKHINEIHMLRESSPSTRVNTREEAKENQEPMTTSENLAKITNIASYGGLKSA